MWRSQEPKFKIHRVRVWIESQLEDFLAVWNGKHSSLHHQSIVNEDFAHFIHLWVIQSDVFGGTASSQLLPAQRQKLWHAVQSGRNSPSPGTATSMAPFSRPPQPSSDNLRSVIQLSSERSYLYWNTTTDSSCKLEICLCPQANCLILLIFGNQVNIVQTQMCFSFPVHASHHKIIYFCYIMLWKMFKNSVWKPRE